MKHKTLQSTKVTLQTVSHEVNLRMYDALFKKSSQEKQTADK